MLAAVGVPEQAFIKKYYRRSLTLTPYPTPSLFFCFCSHLFASYVSLTKRLQQIRVFREF